MTELLLIAVVPGARGTDAKHPTLFLARDERALTSDLREARVWFPAQEQHVLTKLDRVAGPGGPRFGDRLMIVKMTITTVRISQHHLNPASPTYLPQ